MQPQPHNTVPEGAKMESESFRQLVNWMVRQCIKVENMKVTGMPFSVTSSGISISAPSFETSGADLFPVKVTKTGGVAGSTTTDCTWSYTVDDVTGTELDTAVTASFDRIPKVEYKVVTADSFGIACYDTDDSLKLLHVCEEVPVSVTIAEVVTDLSVSGNNLQYKYRKCTVLTADDESASGTWHAGTACA